MAWKVVVRVLLADLILVIPLSLSYTLFSGYVPKSTSTSIINVNFNVGVSKGYQIAIPSIPFLLFLYLFYQLGSFLPTPEKEILSGQSYLVP